MAEPFCVPQDHPTLAGHFPGNPLIPGVVLLDWAWQAALLQLPQGSRLAGLPAAKFLAPVRAGDVLRFDIEVKGSSLTFKVLANTQVAAQGAFRVQLP